MFENIHNVLLFSMLSEQAITYNADPLPAYNIRHSSFIFMYNVRDIPYYNRSIIHSLHG